VGHTITAQKNSADCVLKYGRRHLNQLAHAQGKIQQLPLLRKILEPFSEILHGGRAAGSPRPIVHFDNAIPHRSAATENCSQLCQFRHAPQPSDNPDINSCDFFLFDDLTTKLKGEESDTMEELPAKVEELLGQLTPETMQRAYEHWIERLQQVNHINRDCAESQGSS
jgi:hypothetical protein